MPNRRTWPVVGLQRPIRRLNRVDFPAPLSPRIPVTPPEMAKVDLTQRMNTTVGFPNAIEDHRGNLLRNRFQNRFRAAQPD